MSSGGTRTRPPGHRTVHRRPFPKYSSSGASPGGVRPLGDVTGHGRAEAFDEGSADGDTFGLVSDDPGEQPTSRSATAKTIARMPFVHRRGRAGSRLAERCERYQLRAGRDLPQVAVRVTEVPEVPVLRGCRFPCDAATGRHRLCHDLVHSFARRDDVME